MGEKIRLAAADGHELAGYLARPAGAPKGGIVICQEIFGVNGHIRAVTDGYAEAGYLAIAPALFDRECRGIELDYDSESVAEGREYRSAIAWDDAVADVAAAVEAAAEGGKVGVVGYCWGGSVAWLAGCRLPVAAAIGYYGGQIHEHRAEQPGCPVMLHFGERDAMIPMDQVAEIRERQPEVEVFTYPADHGFNCDHRGSYDAPSAALALERSLAFFTQHLG